MHISEGILTSPVLTGGAVLTALGTAVGLKKLDYDRMAKLVVALHELFAGRAPAPSS